MPLVCLCRAARATILLPAILAVAGGCERNKAPARVDSTTVVIAPAPAAGVVPAGGTTWDSELGPMLLVEGSSPEESIVIGPKADSVMSDAQRAAAAGSEIVLFGRGGSQLTAHFGAAALKQDGDCTVWPLKDVRGDGPTRGWSIGFISRSVKPVALDSVDILTPRDSMTLVAEVSRLASAVTAPSDPAFQGLRFTVHDIRRFESAPGTAALVAHVIRRVNQEANPQEEQTLLIAERDSGVVSGPYRLVYAERTWGLEDRVTTPEVIGAAQYGGHPSLIVARDNEAGVAYAILQRVAAGRWAIRWTSSPTSCG